MTVMHMFHGDVTPYIYHPVRERGRGRETSILMHSIDFIVVANSQECITCVSSTSYHKADISQLTKGSSKCHLH